MASKRCFHWWTFYFIQEKNTKFRLVHSLTTHITQKNSKFIFVLAISLALSQFKLFYSSQIRDKDRLCFVYISAGVKSFERNRLYHIHTLRPECVFSDKGIRQLLLIDNSVLFGCGCFIIIMFLCLGCGRLKWNVYGNFLRLFV